MANSMTNVPELLARRSGRWGVVVALLVAIFVLRLVFSQPAIGVGFLYLLPVLAAGLWFGRAGGVGWAPPPPDCTCSATSPRRAYLLTAALLRLVVFCSVGYAFAVVVEREHGLWRRLRRQEDSSPSSARSGRRSCRRASPTARR